MLMSLFDVQIHKHGVIQQTFLITLIFCTICLGGAKSTRLEDTDFTTLIMAQAMDNVSPQSKQLLPTSLLSRLKMNIKFGKEPHKLSSYSG